MSNEKPSTLEVLPHIPYERRNQGRIYESEFGTPVMHFDNGSPVKIDFSGQRTHQMAELTLDALTKSIGRSEAAEVMYCADIIVLDLLRIFKDMHFDLNAIIGRVDTLYSGFVSCYRILIDTEDGRTCSYDIPAYCVGPVPEDPTIVEEK